MKLLLLLLPILLLSEVKLDPLKHKQAYCLALNIYHEARGSNLADQAAVADVVLNRVTSTRYPNTICQVVKQSIKANGQPVKHKCQFSWYCDGKSDIPQEQDAWEKAQSLAYHMLTNSRFRGISEGSLFYHATYVDPFWANSYHLVGTIGSHKFYKILD